MEHTSPFVAEGKHIDETTYTRRPQKWKELNLNHLKIDHYDPTTRTIREVKKSPKLEQAHIAQVQYYIYALYQQGIKNVSGIIEYPKQKKKVTVVLPSEDHIKMEAWENEVHRITTLDTCPPLVKKPYCKSCAFRDFCYV